jgi:hypothetical protein
MACAAGLLGGVPSGDLEEDDESSPASPSADSSSSSSSASSDSCSHDGSSSCSTGNLCDDDSASSDDDDHSNQRDGRKPRAKARELEWEVVHDSLTPAEHDEAKFNEFLTRGSLRNGTPRAIGGPVKIVKSVGEVRVWRCAFAHTADCPALW